MDQVTCNLCSCCNTNRDYYFDVHNIVSTIYVSMCFCSISNFEDKTCGVYFIGFKFVFLGNRIIII